MKIEHRQIITTLVALIISVLLFEYSPIDIAIQDYFYDFDLGQWKLNRDNKILNFLLYDGIKKLFVIFVLLILIALLFFRNLEVVKAYKKGLTIVCLSALLVPLSVGILKASTNVPCPKNLEHYGGNYPYVTLLSKYPESFYQSKNIKCYPAAHASGGFALMALFFLFKLKKNKIIALMSAQMIGWSTGSYKMLIGDHFLSHTFITMTLAWFIILMITQGVKKWDLT